MKNEASLIIKFYTFYNNPVFDKIKINEEEFTIAPGMEIQKKYTFDKYGQDLGKKYFRYELISKNKKNSFDGSFEISSGNHIIYCFLGDP